MLNLNSLIDFIVTYAIPLKMRIKVIVNLHEIRQQDISVFFGRRGERHLPFGAMLLILVPFLIVGQYFQNRKYNALSASPEHTSTVISNIGYIGNSGPIIHYSFTVNSITYNGGMHANGFAVGDSIGVVYQKDNPENNMTVFEYYDGPSYGFVSALSFLL